MQYKLSSVRVTLVFSVPRLGVGLAHNGVVESPFGRLEPEKEDEALDPDVRWAFWYQVSTLCLNLWKVANGS
jgi:hypothetical protein